MSASAVPAYMVTRSVVRLDISGCEPSGGIVHCTLTGVSLTVEHHSVKVVGAGSNPVRLT